ncbi:MAG: hypothetical protein A2143_09075 [Gallionellales bacterium RBG_16_57_15]|nr:MAG: hypothetical protein A2143_09075 [Gallionellales bacterium RBG_16_57_15]
MSLLIRLATYFVVWVKYRKHRFLFEGGGCNYKFLRSTFSYSEKISLADDVHIGPGCTFDGAGGIRIGRGTIIAPEVVIYSRTHNFDCDLTALPFDDVVLTAPVHVGEFVWIGARAIILPGVTIGDGAVVGAGAVVARDIPACAVVVGNPAQIIRYRDQAVFEKLRAEDEPFVYKRHGHSKLSKMKAN